MIKESYFYQWIYKIIQSYQSSLLVAKFHSMNHKIERLAKNSAIINFFSQGLRFHEKDFHQGKKAPDWLQKLLFTIQVSFFGVLIQGLLSDEIIKDKKSYTYFDITVLVMKYVIFIMVFLLPILLFYKISYGHIILSVPFLFMVLFRRRKLPKAMVLITTLWLSLIGLSAIFSVNIIKSMNVFSSYLLFYSIFLFIVSYFEKKDLDWIFSILIITGSVISLYGLYQYAFADMDQLKSWVDLSLNPLMTARIYGTFGDPNSLATFLMPILMLGAYIVLSSQKIYRQLIFLLLSGLNLIAFLLTFSRSSWIGFAAAFLFVVILYRTSWLLGLILTGFIGFILAPDVISHRVLSIFFSAKDSSMGYREYIWIASTGMIRDYWKSGIGVNYHPFRIIGTQYQPHGIFSLHTHNLYLEWIVETGIFGALSFIYLNCIVIFSGIKNAFMIEKNQDRLMIITATGIVIGYLVTGLVEFNFLYMRNVFLYWIILSTFTLSLKQVSYEN